MPRTPLLVAVIAALALAGCAPLGNPAPPPAASAQPGAEGGPLVIACPDLVSDQAIYDYNPNFGGFDGYSVDAGSLAARVLELEGTACAWQNETGGELIVVAAANPSSALIDGLKAEPSFAVEDGVGTAQAFSGYYWIVASSEDFLEEGDAQPIIDAAVKTLG